MKKKFFCFFQCVIICGIFCTASANSREVKSIDSGWSFSKGMAASRGFGMDRSQSQIIVNLPHTWNSSDFLSDGGYYRGYGTYTKDLDIPADYKGKRLFLKFEGAGSVAYVFINGQYLGEHFGGYNAFVFEVSDKVKFGEKNSVRVVCDNSQRFDLAPQGGDFNIYGGLYRDAWMIVTEEDACISPLYYGSSGVFVKQLSASAARAELRSEVILSTKSDYKNCEVEFSILDKDNKIVTTQTRNAVFDDKVSFNIGFNNPHLWNGTKDPYLYKAVTVLKRNGNEIDRVEENIGIRTFYVDPDKGFFLNGEHLKLRGVCRHQDWDSLASALTEKNHLADFA